MIERKGILKKQSLGRTDQRSFLSANRLIKPIERFFQFTRIIMEFGTKTTYGQLNSSYWNHLWNFDCRLNSGLLNPADHCQEASWNN